MLYTRGFLLTGTLAAAIALAAIAELPADSAARGAREPAITPEDRDALHHLADAVAAHAFARDRLDEPDLDIAGEVMAAAALAGRSIRGALDRLADAASRSAAEFLVDYNLAAGAWEVATGVRMPAAAPAAL